MSKKRQSNTHEETFIPKQARLEIDDAIESTSNSSNSSKFNTALQRVISAAEDKRLAYLRRRQKAEELIAAVRTTLRFHSTSRPSSIPTTSILPLSENIRLVPVFPDAKPLSPLNQVSQSTSLHPITLKNVQHRILIRADVDAVAVKLLLTLQNTSRDEVAAVSISGYPVTPQPCEAKFTTPCSISMNPGDITTFLCVMKLSLGAFAATVSLNINALYTAKSQEEFTLISLNLQRHAGVPLRECINVEFSELLFQDITPKRFLTPCPAVTCRIAHTDKSSDNVSALTQALATFHKWSNDHDVVTFVNISDLLCLLENACVVIHSSSPVIEFSLIAVSDAYLRLLLQALRSALSAEVELVVKLHHDCYDSLKEDDFMNSVTDASSLLLDELSFWAKLLREQQQQKNLMLQPKDKNRQPHYKLGILDAISESSLVRLYAKEEATDDAMIRMFAAYDNISFKI